MLCPVADGYNSRLLEYFNAGGHIVYQDAISILNSRIVECYTENAEYVALTHRQASFCCELATLVLDDINVLHVIEGTAPFPCDEGVPLVVSIHAAVLLRLEKLHLEITERRIVGSRDAQQLVLDRLRDDQRAAEYADKLLSEVLDAALGITGSVGTYTFCMLRALHTSSDDLMAVSDHLASIQ